MKKKYKHFDVLPATPNIGAHIKSIDLSKSQSPDVFTELRNALSQYKVIFFQDQKMTDANFQSFGKNFGTLETHEFFPTVPNYPEIQVITTQGGNTGTDRWHTDVTFKEKPSAASILRAIDIPKDGGGDTMWLCTNAAYNNLSRPMRELLLKLEGIHDMRYGMAGYIDRETVEKSVAKNPRRTHPAIVAHPITQKPHLFINSIWTSGLKGLDRDESVAILHFLYEHVKKPEFQVRFRWQENSIVIWDNIATQHYAVGDYDYLRVMNRMIVKGEKLSAYIDQS